MKPIRELCNLEQNRHFVHDPALRPNLHYVGCPITTFALVLYLPGGRRLNDGEPGAMEYNDESDLKLLRIDIQTL